MKQAWLSGMLAVTALLTNVTASNEQAGITLEDYKKRGLLRAVVGGNNTAYLNGAGGITVPDDGISEVTVVNNAVHAGGSTPAYPASQTGLQMAGDVDCTAIRCFEKPEPRVGERGF